MGGIATRYGNGTIDTTAQWAAPGGGAGAMGIDPFFLEMARRRAEREDQMAEEKLNAMRQARHLQQREADRGGPIDRPMPQAAPMQPKRPVFTKTVGGPGMQGGTIRLNQWEPGAAYAGDEADLGAGPSSASFQGGGGPSGASLQGRPDLNEATTAQRLEDIDQGGGAGGGNFERTRMGSALVRSNAEADARERAAAQRRALLAARA